MGHIFLTGASGFIGKNLLNYLEHNHADQLSRIVLLSNSPSLKFITIPHTDYKFAAESFIENGITSFDAVIHLGGFIPKERSLVNVFDENFSNVSTTVFLLKNLPVNFEKFIFISTVDIYRPGPEIIDELTPPAPGNFYGECKLFCEKAVIQYCNDRAVVPQILRLGHVYGPGEEEFSKLIPQAIKNILNNKNPVIYSNGKEKRSYIHVTDCVEAIWNALKLDKYAGPINIVSSENFEVQDIVQNLVDISKTGLKVETLGKVDQGPDLIFNNQKMILHLSKEKRELLEGLEEEFHLFNKNTTEREKK